VVIGDSSVGKTSLIQMFANKSFSENFKPTVGADFVSKQICIEEDNVVL
jgi:Ras-related protein Rab-7A